MDDWGDFEDGRSVERPAPWWLVFGFVCALVVVGCFFAWVMDLLLQVLTGRGGGQ